MLGTLRWLPGLHWPDQPGQHHRVDGLRQQSFVVQAVVPGQHLQVVVVDVVADQCLGVLQVPANVYGIAGDFHGSVIGLECPEPHELGVRRPLP